MITRRKSALLAQALALGLRVASVTAIAAASGCAYYNGIYNAKAEARKGDAKFREGRDEESHADYALSAAKAESVLVRFPKSKWRTRALFLAGRGEVLAGQCDPGLVRLSEFITRPDADANDREQASIAFAICDIVHRRFTIARARLDSVVASKQSRTAREAKVWAARAALSFGDRDGAEQYLAAVDSKSLQWEMLAASQTAQDWERVESLLLERARAGDYRVDVPAMLRNLWLAGRFDGVDRVVKNYDAARLRDQWRVTMHFAVGDMNLSAGRDSLARQHLFTARRLATNDTIVTREADARLALLSLARASSSRDVDSVFARIDSTTRRSQYYRKASDQLLLYRLFETADDSTGASLFLAAEIARDSLHAPTLAYTLFRRIGNDRTFSLYSAKALAAAARLRPDSAAAFGSRILAEHSTSSVAAWMRGEDPAAQQDFATTDFALRRVWFSVTRTYADSLRRLRENELRIKAPVAR